MTTDHSIFNFIDPECWQLLAIEPTSDLRQIKRAYARQIRVHNPEDNPEKFIEIRNAFEALTQTLENFRDFEPAQDRAGDGNAAHTEPDEDFADNPAAQFALDDSFESQIKQALNEDQCEVAMETLNHLIRTHPTPDAAQEFVHQVAMRQTLDGQLSKAMVSTLGWHWFFSNHQFTFNFSGEHDDLRRFAETLYETMTEPIDSVIEKIEVQLSKGNSQGVTAMVKQTLESQQFDHLEMRRHLRLMLMRTISPKCMFLSSNAILELNEMLHWTTVNDCQNEEDWDKYQILLRKVAVIQDSRARTENHSKPDSTHKRKKDEGKNPDYLENFTKYFIFVLFLIWFGWRMIILINKTF